MRMIISGVFWDLFCITIQIPTLQSNNSKLWVIVFGLIES